MREAGSGRSESLRRHRLFGLTLASEFPFSSRLAPARGDADLSFAAARQAPYEGRLGEALYESPLLDEAGESMSRLYRLAQGELLRFGDALDFYLGEDRIDCHLRDPESHFLIEIRLLGPVLAYWLERQAICVLHAAAVVLEGSAVAFMASHEGGKTSLAAAMMTAGAPLLTDDLLPLESRPGAIEARSGYPQMRMWPDQVARLLAGWRRLERVHPRLEKRRVPVGPGGFGEFHPAAAPLRAIYLPARDPQEGASGEVRIAPLSPRKALIELVRNSFSPFIVEAVGLQGRRLETLARLAGEIPLRRIDYPSGAAALERVRTAVLDDLATL